MRVNEIFLSADGEINGFAGIGELSWFLRLQGCNLSCAYCDTPDSQAPDALINAAGHEIKEMTTQEIIQYILNENPGVRKITITGGEPLLPQRVGEVYDLARELVAHDFRVSIETNGSITPDRDLLPEDVHFIIDYKSSGDFRFDLTQSTCNDILKVPSTSTLDAATKMLAISRMLDSCRNPWVLDTIAISPINGKPEEEPDYNAFLRVMCRIIKDNAHVQQYHWVLNIQAHKKFWKDKV